MSLVFKTTKPVIKIDLLATNCINSHQVMSASNDIFDGPVRKFSKEEKEVHDFSCGPSIQPI